jgi:hypothetical protein
LPRFFGSKALAEKAVLARDLVSEIDLHNYGANAYNHTADSFIKTVPDTWLGLN